MSKLDSLGMVLRLDGYGVGRHARCSGCLDVGRLPVGQRRNCSYRPLFFSLPPHTAVPGRLPEWPKGAVCKTVGFAYVGTNPTPATTCENGPLAANSRAGGRFFSVPACVRPGTCCAAPAAAP